MLLKYILIANCVISCVTAYSNYLFGLSNDTRQSHLQCAQNEKKKDKLKRPAVSWTKTVPPTTVADPLLEFQRVVQQFLHGQKVDSPDPKGYDINDLKKINDRDMLILQLDADLLIHYPDGQLLRADLFNNNSRVYMPPEEFLHRGHVRLNVTKDWMQTAVNAFFIMVHGNIDDIMNLPAAYVLNSARTISMLTLAREKLSAMWKVVKGKTKVNEINYTTLEKFRPLFKYVNGKEIAKLNLSDERILSYVGTHAELSRHQVGVVASKYLQINPDWAQAKYLNLMNNLLCGVPMNLMRKLSSNTYLQLTSEVFYHIRACDPLQRRFYLAMMTKTEALGKSYSWSARDVSRLGMLLAEVDGPELALINPEAMSGITSQVMMVMPAQNLQYITEIQLGYLGHKPLNILARKIKVLQDKMRTERDVAISNYVNLNILIFFMAFMGIDVI